MVKNKFTTEQLMNATIEYLKYRETYDKYGRITITDLAAWTRNNIPGMENVRDYHFNHPRITKGKKGNTIKIENPCSELVKKTVRERDIIEDFFGKTDPLLALDGEGDFSALSTETQKKLIRRMREHFTRMGRDYNYLEFQRNKLNAEIAGFKGYRNMSPVSHWSELITPYGIKITYRDEQGKTVVSKTTKVRLSTDKRIWFIDNEFRVYISETPCTITYVEFNEKTNLALKKESIDFSNYSYPRFKNAARWWPWLDGQ